MTDIVERLRAFNKYAEYNPMLDEAADEIERLRKALKPFAEYEMSCIEFRDGYVRSVPEEWFNRAYAALAKGATP